MYLLTFRRCWPVPAIGLMCTRRPHRRGLQCGRGPLRSRFVLFEPTPLDGSWLIAIEPHVDERGWFARSFCEREFSAHGLPTHFPQSNLSRNDRIGTLRGMHFNIEPFGEEKLVRCVRGAVYDVIVDLRHGSRSRLQWFGAELTADNGSALFVPAGFAHGFLTLSDNSDIEYHMGNFFEPGVGRGIRWNDPALGISWPIDVAVISSRDASYPDLNPDTFDAATWDH